MTNETAYNPFKPKVQSIATLSNCAPNGSSIVSVSTRVRKVRYAEAFFADTLASGQTSGFTSLSASGGALVTVVGWAGSTVYVKFNKINTLDPSGTSGGGNVHGWFTGSTSTDGYSGGTLFVHVYGD